jgi:hypothetical protein
MDEAQWSSNLELSRGGAPSTARSPVARCVDILQLLQGGIAASASAGLRDGFSNGTSGDFTCPPTL